MTYLAGCADLADYPASPPAESLRLLFIHHSCGGQLLAAPGADKGEHSIYSTHSNAGDLRRRLAANGYEVHEASYGSRVGERTDLFDWLPKFRDQMPDVLACNHQDERYTDGRTNRIVMFKSCYPNNDFRSEGSAPGDPEGPDLTLWNARAAYTALLAEFAKHPEVLFVCVTAPPLAPKRRRRGPAWKRLLKKLLGRSTEPAVAAKLARAFSDWLTYKDGWLSGYGLKNVVVFDYYDLLTGQGRSDQAAYATRDGYDSHPSSAGNVLAAEHFVPFLNRAVRRAGMAASETARALAP